MFESFLLGSLVVANIFIFRFQYLLSSLSSNFLKKGRHWLHLRSIGYRVSNNFEWYRTWGFSCRANGGSCSWSPRSSELWRGYRFVTRDIDLMERSQYKTFWLMRYFYVSRHYSMDKRVRMLLRYGTFCHNTNVDACRAVVQTSFQKKWVLLCVRTFP